MCPCRQSTSIVFSVRAAGAITSIRARVFEDWGSPPSSLVAILATSTHRARSKRAFGINLMLVSSSHLAPNRRLTFGIGLFLIVVSLTVLAGWVLDLPVLTGLSGDITMKVNAALALFGSGVALLLLPSTRPSARIGGRAGAIVASVLGALTFSEHVVGWNLGIDELFFEELPGAVATMSPGRMGPNASLSLTLAGIALLLLYHGRAWSIARAQLIGACIVVFALVPIVGYVYGAPQLYAVARYTGIAIHTGIALLALGVAILTAHSDIGPVAALKGNSPHSVVGRRLLAQAVALPLLLGYISLAGERQGLYDARFGIGMFVVAMIVLLSITTWRATAAHDRMDAARRAAQQERDDLLVRERAARERAERADQTKDQFIAALSHELRTPLNAIVGWTQMLRRGAVSGTSRAKAEDAVSRNANALTRLIEDLLDTSRIATGHLQLAKGPVDINASVHAAVESVLPAANTKGISVIVTPALASPVVVGDAQRLQQVLWNVLVNAVKFTTAPGTVRVDVATGDGGVRVAISDDGAGIDPAFLPRVFEQFEQGSASTQGNGSLGLGLHIAKHLVERHGGSIQAHSDGVGRGAVFTIQLPLAEHGTAISS
jgi:signal transduction histidine kinase